MISDMVTQPGMVFVVASTLETLAWAIGTWLALDALIAWILWKKKDNDK